MLPRSPPGLVLVPPALTPTLTLSLPLPYFFLDFLLFTLIPAPFPLALLSSTTLLFSSTFPSLDTLPPVLHVRFFCTLLSPLAPWQSFSSHPVSSRFRFVFLLSFIFLLFHSLPSLFIHSPPVLFSYFFSLCSLSPAVPPPFSYHPLSSRSSPLNKYDEMA